MPDKHIIEAADEIQQERAAIAEYEGLLSTEEAERLGLLESERYKLSYQTRFCLALQTLDGRQDYLAMVERRDGLQHADKLRELVKANWSLRKEKK